MSALFSLESRSMCYEVSPVVHPSEIITPPAGLNTSPLRTFAKKIYKIYSCIPFYHEMQIWYSLKVYNARC
jgi:hypothetical protein